MACGCGPKYVNRARVSCKDMNAGEACFSRATNAYTYTQVYAHAHTHTHTQALAHAYTHKRAQPLTHPPTPRYIHIHTNERNHPPTPRHTHTCTRRVGCCSLEALLRTPGHQPPWFSNQGVFVGVWVGEWVGGPGRGGCVCVWFGCQWECEWEKGDGVFLSSALVHDVMPGWDALRIAKPRLSIFPAPAHATCRQAGIHFASQSFTLFLSSALAHRTCTHFARQECTPQHRASLYSLIPHLCTYVSPGWHTLCIAKLHSFSVFRTRTPHLHTFCLSIFPAPAHACVARLGYTLHRKAPLFFCLPHSHTALAHILPGREALRNTELHFIQCSRTCARMCCQAGIHEGEDVRASVVDRLYMCHEKVSA